MSPFSTTTKATTSHSSVGVSKTEGGDTRLVQNTSLSKEEAQEVESERLQQRRMQRQQLKRYVESDDESCNDKEGTNKADANDSDGSTNSNNSNCIKEITNPDSSSSTPTKINGNHADTKVSSQTSSQSQKLSIISTENSSEVANQNLNGELSLLHNYENKGVMNEVFGSQSLLSQELIYTQQSFPGKNDKDEINTKVTSNKSKRSSVSDAHSLAFDDQSTSSSKLAISAIDASFSQTSFFKELGTQDSQALDDTICASNNLPLSQLSALSGYDYIIGAAQALAERNAEKDGYQNGHSNDLDSRKDANRDDAVPPIPPLPFLPVKDLRRQEEGALSVTMKSEPNTDDTLTTRKRPRSDLQNDLALSKSDKISKSGAASEAGYIRTNGTTYTVRKTKLERKQMEEETNYIAKRTAELVSQLRVNRKVEKQFLLSMALTRENPRSAPTSYPPKGTTILNGFYWGQFPPLEQVLRSHMEEYYELSIEKCQSRTQQAFNNKLVVLIRAKAEEYNWTFDPAEFDDKKIRDRIRCFFKTHIQNAKKRLKTMVKNPLKRANAKALAAHLHLIESCDLIDKYDEEQIAVADVENSMPSLSTDQSSSRNKYDSDAHDAAQVVCKLFRSSSACFIM